MTFRVAVVIPTWNRAALLAQALENLGRQTYPIERVIVVDNGSTDDSAAVAARGGAHVITLAANAGFAAAVNRGIREAAGAEWIGVLNNDVTLEPDWLARLMASICNRPGLLPASFWMPWRMSELTVRSTRFAGAAAPGDAGRGAWIRHSGTSSRTIQLAPFTAAVFRAGLFERVGLLDESFESYLEDVDFGLRCAEAGLSGLYVPEAVAYHQGSATLGRWHPDTVRKIARNQLLIVAKHYPPNWILRYGWPVFIAQTLWGFIALRHGALLSYLAGKVEGLRRFREARGKHCADFLPSATRCDRPLCCHPRAKREGDPRDSAINGVRSVLETVLRSHMTRTGVVIVTYNSAGMIERCLKSCGDLPVVVVDNASKDGTCELVRRHTFATLIANPGNYGFAGAANQGVSALDTHTGPAIESRCRAEDTNRRVGGSVPGSRNWLSGGPAYRRDRVSRSVVSRSAVFPRRRH